MTYTEAQYQKDKDTLIRIRPLIESIGKRRNGDKDTPRTQIPFIT